MSVVTKPRQGDGSAYTKKHFVPTAKRRSVSAHESRPDTRLLPY